MESLFEVLGNGLQGASLFALAAAALWGVASMVLSPCHLAGIPLIVGFIHGREVVGRGRAVALAALFATGILLTIGMIGLLTAALGRVAGDLGPWANYLVALIFLLAGLHLLDVLPAPWTARESLPMQSRGPLAALVLGLVFGIALGPCTFAYMAPVLALAFGNAAISPAFSIALLLAFGLGHCAVIVLAGSAGGLVRRIVSWNARTQGVTPFRRGCGVLVIAAALYLLWTAG